MSNTVNSPGSTALNSPPGRDMHSLVKKYTPNPRGVFPIGNLLVDFPMGNKIITIANDSI